MRIGEVAETTGTSAKTLRFYEAQGLLPEPDRTSSSYRDYSPDVIARVDFIHRGKAAGLTLAQIRDILHIRDQGEAPCEHVLELLARRVGELDTQIRELRTLRRSILDLRERAARLEPTACGDDDRVCHYL